MNVSDGERLAVAIAKFQQAADLVNQGQKIVQYLFEIGETNVEIPEGFGLVEPCMLRTADGNDVGPCDSVTGLYPGQIPDQTEEEPEDAECLD